MATSRRNRSGKGGRPGAEAGRGEGVGILVSSTYCVVHCAQHSHTPRPNVRRGHESRGLSPMTAKQIEALRKKADQAKQVARAGADRLCQTIDTLTAALTNGGQTLNAAHPNKAAKKTTPAAPKS